MFEIHSAGNSHMPLRVPRRLHPSRSARSQIRNPKFTVHRHLGEAVSVAGTRFLRKIGATRASRQVLFYWKKKYVDDTFHSLGWGGLRVLKYPMATFAVISLLVWSILVARPCSAIADYLRILNGPPHFLDVKRTWLVRLFASWRWSWKKPVIEQVVSHSPHHLICEIF